MVTLGKVPASEVRAFAYTKYILPARQQGRKTVAIRAGDVHKAMGLKDRMPLVCTAIGAKRFEEEFSLRKIRQTGPAQSTTTTYEFEI